MAQAKCPKCGNTALIHHGSEMKRRALTFLCLALFLAAIGAALQLFDVFAWPFILYGTSCFVLLQAGVKWVDHAVCYCKACDLRHYDWFRS